MEKEEVLKRVRNFISEEFLSDGQEIADDESLFASGIIDSLGMIKLTAFVEEAFGMPVNASEVTMDNFGSIEEIAKRVTSKME